MLWAHALAAGDGLPNATCATLGISTTVEFVSVRATRGPKDGAVWASYCAEMTSVGMLLSVMSRMALDTGGTCQTSQFERMNWRFGAFLRVLWFVRPISPTATLIGKSFNFNEI